MAEEKPIRTVQDLVEALEEAADEHDLWEAPVQILPLAGAIQSINLVEPEYHEDSGVTTVWIRTEEI